MAKNRTSNEGLVLRLYVAANAPNSVIAIANIRAICNEHFSARYKLEIVDSLKEPLRALADGIILTPTLVKLLPLPVQRVIGNLNDTAQLLLTLGNK